MPALKKGSSSPGTERPRNHWSAGPKNLFKVWWVYANVLESVLICVIVRSTLHSRITLEKRHTVTLDQHCPRVYRHVEQKHLRDRPIPALGVNRSPIKPQVAAFSMYMTPIPNFANPAHNRAWICRCATSDHYPGPTAGQWWADKQLDQLFSSNQPRPDSEPDRRYSTWQR